MNLREMATRIMNNKGTLPLIFEACAYSMLSTKLLNISQKWPERIIQAEQDRNLKSLKSNYSDSIQKNKRQKLFDIVRMSL